MNMVFMKGFLMKMNKLTVACALFCAILAHGSVASAYSFKESKPSKNVDDSYVRGFVKSMNNRNVTYDGDRLVIYASPSILLTIVCSAIGIIGTGSGVFLTALSMTPSNRNVTASDRFLVGFLGVALAALGGVGLYAGIDGIKKLVTDVPYLTFDALGLTVYDKRALLWSSVQSVSVSQRIVSYYTSQRVTDSMSISMPHQEVVNELSFRDIYANDLLTISSDEHMLPIMIENVEAVAKYYHKKYGN
jgi:hypothetical protein